MKVVIGPYKNYWGPYQIAEKILFWMDEPDERVDKFGKWLATNKEGGDSRLTKLCSWFEKKRKRKIKVRIDPYDTWGMDTTLSYIILPMLKQLKATKHGSPYIDDADLPEVLRLNERERKVFDNGHWDKDLAATKEEIDAASVKFHAQWDWVMDQMIWSFEQELDEDEGHARYYDPYEPNEPIVRQKITVVNDSGIEVEEEWDKFEDSVAREFGKFNRDKYKAYQEKKQLGFTLFGRYFQNLWD